MHSRHYFASSNCIFMQLQESYLFNFKEMIYLLTVKEILILSNNIIFIHKNYNRSRLLYSTRVIIFLSRNRISSFKEIYPRSTKYISSGKLCPFKEIYLFKELILIRSSSRPYVHSRKLYLLNIVAFAE